MKKISVSKKCVMALGFVASLAFASIASAGGLTNVSMTPVLGTDPGLNTPAPVLHLGTIDSSQTITFTFTNTSLMNVGTVVYPKIIANNSVVGFSTTTVSTQTQQMEISTTVGAILSAVGCDTNAHCANAITIGWGISPDGNFTDSLLVNFDYR